MSKLYTHTVDVVGCDSRTPDNYRKTYKCRVTKTMIITSWDRYSRKTGFPIPREAWPMYMLDLSSLKELE